MESVAIAMNGLLTVVLLMFVLRIPMSWYPQLDVTQFPYSWAYYPTEWVLKPLRRVVPPWGGVDMTPVIGVAVISFVREILLGQQGLITMSLY